MEFILQKTSLFLNKLQNLSNRKNLKKSLKINCRKKLRRINKNKSNNNNNNKAIAIEIAVVIVVYFSELNHRDYLKFYEK